MFFVTLLGTKTILLVAGLKEYTVFRSLIVEIITNSDFFFDRVCWTFKRRLGVKKTLSFVFWRCNLSLLDQFVWLEVVIRMNAPYTGPQYPFVHIVQAEWGSIEHEDEDQLPQERPLVWIKKVWKVAEDLDELANHEVDGLRHEENKLQKGQVFEDFAGAYHIPGDCWKSQVNHRQIKLTNSNHEQTKSLNEKDPHRSHHEWDNAKHLESYLRHYDREDQLDDDHEDEDD